jgi:cell division protein FtsW (lipid II flippase)
MDLVAELFLGAFLVLMSVFLVTDEALLQNGRVIQLFVTLNLSILSILSSIYSKSYPKENKPDEFVKDIVALLFIGFVTTILLLGSLLNTQLIQNEYIWGQLFSDITALIYVSIGITSTDYSQNNNDSKSSDEQKQT